MLTDRETKARLNAENKVLHRLSRELNARLSPLPFVKRYSSYQEPPHLTALIPTRNGIPVIKQEVIIVDNSTPLDTEEVRAVLQEFYLNHSLKDSWLQEYLLVELTIADGEICVVPA